MNTSRRRFFGALTAGLLPLVGTSSASLTNSRGGDGSLRQVEETSLGNVERDVMVEMTDRVQLATDIYHPSESGPNPTIVLRTPYDKGSSLQDPYLRAFVENGYVVVKQDVRGRFKSGGMWEPLFYEAEDGYDTIEWAADQEWCTGDVGMYGHSYDGMSSWEAALTDPPSLKAIVPINSPTNFYRGWYKGGAYKIAQHINWSLFNTRLPRLPYAESKKEELRQELNRDPSELYRFLPMSELPVFDDQVAPFYFDWLLHETYDDYWKRISVTEYIEDVSAKVLTVGGMYDPFLVGQRDAWQAINERGQDQVRETQHMILGPWPHRTPIETGPVGDRDFGEVATTVGTPADIVSWFDRWLKPSDSSSADSERLPPVQYFQMGANEWRSAESWPPEPYTEEEYYLNSDGSAHECPNNGSLMHDRPKDGAASDSYTYDPFDPTPTVGGPVVGGGVEDQTPVERRADVLSFTTDELTAPVEVAGYPRVTLFIESTAPDTDFGAKLIDVEPDGYAANITEGYLRTRYRNSLETWDFIEPETVYEITIDLRSVAHTFDEGHKIQLDVASSNFPRFSRNPNRAISVSTATEEDMRSATNTVYHSARRPSHLVLPTRGDGGQRDS